MTFAEYRSALQAIDSGKVDGEALALIRSVIVDAMAPDGAPARSKALRSTYDEVMTAIGSLKGSVEAPKVAEALADTAIAAKLALAQMGK